MSSNIVLYEKVDIDSMYRLMHSKKLIKWDEEQRQKLIINKRLKQQRDIDIQVDTEISNQYELEKERDPRVHFTLSPLSKYLETVDLSSSTVEVSYSVDGFGRFKNSTRMGLSYSYMNMFREIRNLSAHKYVYDIDISNCHWDLLENICNENNIMCAELKLFNEKRTKYMEDIIVNSDKTREDVKIFLNKLLYKYNDDNFEVSFNVEFGKSSPEWVSRLKGEIKKITIVVINLSKYKNIYDWKVIKMKEKNKVFNKEGKILSVIVQELERKVLEKLYDTICKDNVIVRALIHDGLHIDKDNLSKEELGTKLKKWMDVVNDYFGFAKKLILINKDMKIDESYLETTIDFMNYYKHKIEFEKKYFKIKSPLMYRYNTSYNIELEDITNLDNDDSKSVMISDYYSYDRFVKHDELIKAEQDHQYKNFIKKWLEDPYKRQYDTLMFYPYTGIKSPLSNNIYNTFDSFEIVKYNNDKIDIINKELKRKHLENKASILFNYLKKIGKDDNGFNFLCNWIAHIIQYPHKKTGCCIVLKGKQGKGKNTLYNLLKAIIGDKYCAETPNIEHIYGKFAGCRADKLLILLDEIEFKNTKEELGKIKTSITTDNFILEKKGVDGIKYKSFENYIFASNNDLCLPIEDSNRRFFVIDVNSINYGNDDEMKIYFDNLYNIIGDKKMGIVPKYDILSAFYEYMLLIDNVDKYNFRKAIINFSIDAKAITIKNPVDTFLEQLLYKEAENNFELKKFTKNDGKGIRVKVINKIDCLQAVYKQSYLFKEFNIFYKGIANKDSNIHNNMFARELIKDREYITDIKTDGINVLVIDIDKWKEAYNFKKAEVDDDGDLVF